MTKFSHLDDKGNVDMVDVSTKKVSTRVARARSIVRVEKEILDQFTDGDIHTKKGPVFQTARIAGIMAAKKTSELIPLCHPLMLNKCKVDIAIIDDAIQIDSLITLEGKTGVEMEALTAASVAALTIYDMCKAFSHNIIISETKLMSKTGGKSDFRRED